MSVLYKSQRIGKGGKEFTIYKFRTLKENSDIYEFVNEDTYTWCGRFLRKTKLDELPALWNILKGDMNLFGYRPEEKRTWDMYTQDIKEFLSKHKPGFIDLSSIHFFNEEKIMQLSNNSKQVYWERIFPIKMALRSFYFENKSFPLKVALAWIVFKKMVKSLFNK
jgi:lipopolysaccharide/colanic/teichoic acid biosynthesis glycosyltransferase